jgi:catechol 2,3-dioxygenase-like lactoylglutathione lyase family enzyme
MSAPGQVSQVALSVADLDRSSRFYRDVLGFLPAGGERVRGRLAARVMGLPDVDAKLRWLVGRDERAQLELFQFARPAPGPRTAADDAAGWRRVGLVVRDLDAVLARAGSARVTDGRAGDGGARGQRRCTLRDPDGVLLDLMERDPLDGAPAPRHDAPVALRTVTLGVADPERMRAFFVDVLGLSEQRGPGGDHVLGSGGIRLELIPCDRSDAPARLQDYGLLNVALGFRERAEFRRCVERVRASGHRLLSAPLDAGWFSVVYCAGPEGVSVELLYVHRWCERFTGYVPRGGKARS